MNTPIPLLPVTYACMFAAGMGVAAMAQGERKVIVEAVKDSSGYYTPKCRKSGSSIQDSIVVEAGRLALKFARANNYTVWTDAIQIPKDSTSLVKNARAILLTYWPDVLGVGQHLFLSTNDGTCSGSYGLVKLGLTLNEHPSVLKLFVDVSFDKAHGFY